MELSTKLSLILLVGRVVDSCIDIISYPEKLSDGLHSGGVYRSVKETLA
jgi:hypothetical protein